MIKLILFLILIFYLQQCYLVFAFENNKSKTWKFLKIFKIKNYVKYITNKNKCLESGHYTISRIYFLGVLSYLDLVRHDQ